MLSDRLALLHLHSHEGKQAVNNKPNETVIKTRSVITIKFGSISKCCHFSNEELYDVCIMLWCKKWELSLVALVVSFHVSRRALCGTLRKFVRICFCCFRTQVPVRSETYTFFDWIYQSLVGKIYIFSAIEER